MFFKIEFFIFFLFLSHFFEFLYLNMASEYYAREATLDDLKFAAEGTDVYNSAYNTHGK
jgi:hypothetical protein